MEYRKQQELNNMQVIYDDLPVSKPVPIPRPETKIQMPAIVQPIALSPMVTLQESVVLRQADQSEVSSSRDYSARAEDVDAVAEKKSRGKVRLAGFFMLLFSLIYIAPFVLPVVGFAPSFQISTFTLSIGYAGKYSAIQVLMNMFSAGFSVDALLANIISVVLAVTILFAAIILIVGLIKLISGGGANVRPGTGAYLAFSIINLLLLAVIVVLQIVGMPALGIEKVSDILGLFTGDGMAVALLLVTAVLVLLFAGISAGIAKKKSGYN